MNAHTVNGDTATIYIKNLHGEMVAEAIIDASDLQSLIEAGWNWHAYKKKGRGLRVSAFDGQSTVYLSRFLMDAPRGLEVDHVNGNTLDNRRENLRIVTRKQNQQNLHGARAGSSTGVRGVEWHAPKGKFRAYLHLDGKKKHLGYFDSLTDADAAARAGRRLHYTHSSEGGAA